MIRSVHFENFRCLRDVELSLEPLTVLVGPGASGKTAVLEGMQYRLSCEHSDFWSMDTTQPISVRWTYTDGSQMHLCLPRLEFDSISTHCHTVQGLGLELSALRGDSTVGYDTALSPTGDNLASVFASLGAPQREAVVRELCRLVPSIGEVGLQQTGPRSHRLRFRDRWQPNVWFTPWQVADSVLILLTFLVLPYQSPLPDVLTLDEPERGLPSRILGEVMSMLRRMSTGMLGARPVQILLATHSSELLEHVQPDEVRILSRSPEDGSVRVTQPLLDALDWPPRFRQAS